MSRIFIINKKIIFEPEKKSISGENSSVSISASAAFCFELLIMNSGELVTHEQLYDFAWRKFGMEPTSTSLYQNISNLRRALKQCGLNEGIIRTMPRRGFLLSPVAEIVHPPPTPDAEALPVLAATDTVAQPEKGGATSQPSEINKENSASYHYENNSDRKIKSLKILSPYIIVIIFMTLLTQLYLYKNEEQQNDALFVSVMNGANCSIFFNRDSRLNSAEKNKVISRLDISCREKQFYYITTYNNADRTSVFTCQKPLLSSDISYCHSEYFIGDLIHE